MRNSAIHSKHQNKEGQSGEMAQLQQLSRFVGRRSWRRFYSTVSPATVDKTAAGSSPQEVVIEKEKRYGAHNYQPVPVALSRGSGVFLWDVEGKRYFDFLSGYSAVNQGHLHPKIVAAMMDQVTKLTLTSRAFYNDALGEFAEYATGVFGYDKLLPMNSGVEAVETAVKLSRRWGYDVKGIPDNKAKVYFAEGNFHGRSLLAVSASTDPDSFGGYGPFLPNIHTVPFDNLDALEEACSDSDVCAFVVEPVQGENGVVVPSDGYLRGVRDICSKHNVLFVADEVQTGLGRTGKLLAVEHEGVRPDLVILGKSISGGLLPVSCVLADDEVMLTIKPGQHGSTFGGSPLASRVAIASIKAILEENMIENAVAMESVMKRELSQLDPSVVHTLRGRGLFFAIVINSNPEVPETTAWNVCMRLKDEGLLAKPTHDNIIRLAPPLIINEEQLIEACSIVKKVINN